jgi:hypothetical protein
VASVARPSLSSLSKGAWDMMAVVLPMWAVPREEHGSRYEHWQCPRWSLDLLQDQGWGEVLGSRGAAGHVRMSALLWAPSPTGTP